MCLKCIPIGNKICPLPTFYTPSFRLFIHQTSFGHNKCLYIQPSMTDDINNIFLQKEKVLTKVAHVVLLLTTVIVAIISSLCLVTCPPLRCLRCSSGFRNFVLRDSNGCRVCKCRSLCKVRCFLKQISFWCEKH